MTERRYVVEITDTYGECDFDYFENERDAIECAEGMDIAANARVIDRCEQVAIWPTVTTVGCPRSAS